MPDTNQKDDTGGIFPTDVERLKIENILLKQKADLDDQFRKHVARVEEQISKGKFRLGFAGFFLLCITWYGTYKELEGRVQKRLEEEFEAKEIRALIEKAVNERVDKLTQKKMTEYADLEHNQLRCISDKNGRENFALVCRIDGGKFDEFRAVCIDVRGGENYYEPVFPKIDCEKVWQASAAGVGSQPARR